MYPHTYPLLAPQPGGADVLRIRIMFLHSPKRPRDDCLANDFRLPRCLVFIQIESQLSNLRTTCVNCMMAPLRTASSERLVLIPATLKNSTTGYKNVNFDRRNMKFQVHVRDGGKRVHLGYFDTAEEAATAYARSEYGRADAAKLLQPRPAPTAAGAEAIRQAEREGLTLATSSNSTGYKGDSYCPQERGSKKGAAAKEPA